MNPVSLSYIHYPADHPETSPKVLFVHGAESSKETWSSVLDGLKGKYDMYAIDLRGHGESPLGDPPYTIEKLVDDIYQFVEKMDIPHFSLVAHSMGSRVAVCFADKYPWLIQSLLIEDMEMLPRDPQVLEKGEQERLLTFRQTHPSLDSVSNELVAFGYNHTKFQSWLKQGRIKKIDSQYFIGINPYVNFLALNAISASDCAEKAFKKLQKHSFPITLLRAESDSSITELGLEAMSKDVPKLICITVPKSTHSIHKTNSTDFLSILKSSTNPSLKYL